MGDVAVIYKIMPESLEVDLETLKGNLIKEVEGKVKSHTIEEKPVAFGLKAIYLSIVVADQGGTADAIQDALGALEGVQSAEVETLTLI